MRQREIYAELYGFPDDVGLRHVKQRRFHTQYRSTLDACLGRQICQGLKSLYELRSAIRIARVIERIHADEDMICSDHLRVRQCERKENRVASGDVSCRYVGRRFRYAPIFRNVDRIRERRSPKCSQIHLDRPKFLCIKRVGYAPRCLKFNAVALTVIERKAVALEPFLFRDSETCGRIESAA